MGDLERIPPVREQYILEHTNPHELAVFLRAEVKRGNVRLLGPIHQSGPGVWGALVVDVQRRSMPARRDFFLARVIGVSVFLGATGAFLWWVVTEFVALLAALSVTGVIGALVLGGLLWAAVRSNSCETTVTIRHRH